MLRKKGVVGKFVEFFGAGLADLPLADRATIANMAPEYGATCGIFPVDAETLRYLRFTGRPEELSRSWSRPTPRNRGCSTRPSTPEAAYSDTLELDLATVEPSLAGPTRPQDRVRAGRREEVVRRRAARPAEQGQAEAGERHVSWPSPRRSRRLARRRRSDPRRRRDARPRTCATARSSSRPSPAAPTPRTRR